MTNEDICNIIIRQNNCGGIACSRCPLNVGEFDCYKYDSTGDEHHKAVAAKAYLAAQWQPKHGETVEVRSKSSGCMVWYEREFVLKHKGVYVCECFGNPQHLISWEECRQIKPRHTITIDGKDIELSEESFKALQESLKE